MWGGEGAAPSRAARAFYRDRPRSVDVDPDDVPHRSAAASIAGDDETQCMIRKQGAVHVIGELNWSAGKLRCKFGESDNRGVAVRAGDPDRKTNLLSGLGRIDCAGGDKNIPKQRPGPFALLLAM